MAQKQRGERILEAAGELLLAWGYRRVTIDEIARRAGVGKGTVYLHWKTKDALLLAVVLRAKARSLHRQLERMRADPLEVLPSRMMCGLYLDYLDDPVLRALYSDDSDVLGRLNDTAKQELAELMAHGDRILRRHLGVLRGHGLMRDDVEVAHQHYAMMAVTAGFFMTETLQAGPPLPPAVRTGILAHTLRGVLETPDATEHHDPATADAHRAPAVAAVAPEIIALYEQLEELSSAEMRRQLRD
ncbi:TetR/AcrR family transcriptional regulator [Streptomyces natalensis]|uniref:TetR family transcriptional regulator n=1 Tax=Streptomyces natalensis ATCC 27448 TaxID=1240678 RepID=A0A0D7CMK3_9ACTN|nr:TetR/AcrR family transcriptional regulator [Streptomyces natalensis]KIZ17095.1 TetR family transcriptional regulator [Streptomyces natalensis ATCC 27448]